ncbi:MAG: hypothetical protein QOD00_1753, partial [Blastocatellia bacterium]|nr:hypothetical protein [Blastocatellia bacterium]
MNRAANSSSQQRTRFFMKEQEARPLIIKRVRDEARETRSFDMLPASVDSSNSDGGTGAHGLTFLPGQVAVLRAGG